MGTRTPTAVWLVDAELVVALDAHLGPPIDSYVNGSQTWLTPDGPGDVELEWRLHPVAGYRAPMSSHLPDAANGRPSQPRRLRTRTARRPRRPGTSYRGEREVGEIAAQRLRASSTDRA